LEVDHATLACAVHFALVASGGSGCDSAMMPILVWVLPALIAVLALPMALEMIPPNRWYGLRTPKTLSSPDIWYSANRFSGWVLVAANSLVICFNLVLLWLHPDWERNTLLLIQVAAMGGALLLGIVVSLLYLLML
jgi:hypothetical protein